MIPGILFSCANKMEEVEKIIHTENKPIKTAKEVSLIYSERAKAQVKINAPVMEEYVDEDDNYIEMPEGMEVLFFDSLMHVKSRLTAKYSIHKVSEKVMEAYNDVEVVNENGEQLNTEKLIWKQDSAKIYSDKMVKITTKDEIILGEGMEAEQDFTEYKIHRIKGIINIEEDSIH